MTTPSGRKRGSAFLPRPLRVAVKDGSLHRRLTGVPLSWALTVPFVLLTVGTTALVGYLSYRSGEQTVTELASQLMQEKENQTVLYLERSLEMPHLINQLNADNIRLGSLSGFETTNPEPLEKFFWAQLHRFPDVTTIAMANDRGGMVGSGRRLPLGSGNMSVYRTTQFARGKYTLSLTDAKGKITETQTISENYDARTRPWYQAPAKAGKATWSPIYQFISDAPVMGISAGLPIYSDSGKLRGILAADIDLKSLSYFLANLNLSPSGQVFIVERSGLLVANSTNQSILKTQSGEAERMNAGESEDPTMREAMAQLNARSQGLSQINGTQQFTIDQSDSAKWVRVTPFQDRYGLDWLIVMVVPESDFMQAIHANQATTLLLCLLTLGGAIGLGIFATNRLTRHFAQLNRVSQELAAGNLNRRLLTNGSIAELNGLAHTFNRMADQIQDSFDRIKTALAESKERFTTIFRISPEPLAITNFADGCLLEVNESAMQFYGYSRAEIIGNTALQLNFWHELEQREQYRSLLTQQGSVRNLEVQVRLKSGEVKTVLLSAEVCKLEGQERIIVTHRDITDRKAAELALQQSEARYRAIVEDQTELVCRSLPDTTVTFVNDACCRYFGVNREEMIGKSYRHLIYEPDRAEVERNITALSIDQPIITSENRWVVNGEVRWMQWSDRLLFDDQGNPTEIQSVGRDITHLKKAEEALRQSEERNRAILSAMPDLMTLISAEGIYRDIVRSNSLVDLIPLNINPVGKHLSEVVPPEIAAAKFQLIQQTLETGEMKTLEQQVWLDDRWQYEEVRTVPCGSDAVLMMIRDITDRKQTEIALQHSENRFQRIAAASPAQIYILVCDAKGSNLRFEYISPGVREIQELEPEQVLQDATLTYAQVHPDDLALYDEATYRTFKTLEPFSHEWRIITPSGKLKWVQANSRPERRDNGDIAWYGVLLDITERKRVEDEHKQAEIALQESEARFQEIAQTISQIFFVLDLTTDQYLYISPSYEKLWGYSPESLYRDPKSWLDRVHPDDVEYVLSGFNQIPDDNRNLQEYRMIATDGTIHWMRAESWIVRDENGNPIREVGLADDITDRKQLEQTLRSQAEEEHLLTTITQNIRQSLDLHQILATTVAEVQQTLKVDRVLIFRLHPDGSGQVIQEAVVPQYPVTDQMRWEDEHFPAECYEFYRQGIPRIVLDVAADPWADCLTEFMHSIGVKSKIVAPIVQSHGETSTVWGLLIVHACANRRQWQQSEADLLQKICNQLAIAIGQANLYQQLQIELAERKQVEEALRRNEARIKQVADASPAIIYTVEEYGGGPVRFEFLSPGFEEVHEIPVADVLDNPALVFSCFHPDDQEGYLQAVSRAAVAMQPFQYTWRILTPSGKIKWLQGSSRPERRADGILIWHGVILDITELKRAEEALRQSEAALRRAQQVAHVGSWQLEAQTGKITWTEESFHIMGWDVAQTEPPLPLFYKLIHPDDRDLLRRCVEAVIAHQIPYRVEFRVVHPDGSLRYVEARGEAVVNEAGHTIHVIGTNLDITERKQAEEALRNSEATKEQILKAIPDLILWMTENGTCIDLIEGNSITNLYNKSEAVGKNLFEILPFDLAQTRVNAIQQALETGEVQIYEQEVALPSVFIYEEVRVIPVGDDRVLVIVRDITDRKRAEAALLDSETRFRSAFSDAPIGMALIGLDDRWLKVNPMLCDMLDFTEPELLSRTASSLVHPEDWHKLEQCVQQVLSSENRNAQVELRYCCQQGQIVWGLTSLSLVRDGQGKPLYYVAQIQDVTERQAIDRMKNEFISIVSHELRTPLTAIRGFLGLLDTGIYDKKPEKAKHMIGQALTNSDRLVRLVNDILDLERLSSGKVQITKEACGAEDLMQRAAAGVQLLADQANVQLIIVPTTAQAWADPDCIIQTLTNLLSNAIKFSPPDAAITLSAQTRTDSVLFSVQDQGRGIPADKLETIFGRFQQVDVSDSRQKGGTGLGLAICRSIMQQHGGSIWAESILGNGSTFYFTLPLMSEGER